eukprot:3501531-Prymnesium_polylepis.1
MAARELLRLIDKGAMRRVAVSIASGMAILVRDTAARITPSLIDRIGQAAAQTLTAISMLIISLSDAISQLFRTLTGSAHRMVEQPLPGGGHTGGMPWPPPAAPAAPAAPVAAN